MECRLVCPAHTNYLEMVFDFIVTGIYGNQVFSDWLVQNGIAVHTLERINYSSNYFGITTWSIKWTTPLL